MLCDGVWLDPCRKTSISPYLSNGRQPIEEVPPKVQLDDTLFHHAVGMGNSSRATQLQKTPSEEERRWQRQEDRANKLWWPMNLVNFGPTLHAPKRSQKGNLSFLNTPENDSHETMTTIWRFKYWPFLTFKFCRCEPWVFLPSCLHWSPSSKSLPRALHIPKLCWWTAYLWALMLLRTWAALTNRDSMGMFFFLFFVINIYNIYIYINMIVCLYTSLIYHTLNAFLDLDKNISSLGEYGWGGPLFRFADLFSRTVAPYRNDTLEPWGLPETDLSLCVFAHFNFRDTTCFYQIW